MVEFKDDGIRQSAVNAGMRGEVAHDLASARFMSLLDL